jgi:hypothetical protein
MKNATLLMSDKGAVYPEGLPKRNAPYDEKSYSQANY